ncbi:hypothetical protein [Providencia rettgeri]|nr:hypothetical protein [Providencia rettgeri]MBS0859505.1 hypothetical protein [Providencia rettgeri]MBS0873152.1 hypothetical protein [Providencia rettgeri]MBS0920554.1 hypothetical protein [Providencia rettgeri]
MLYGSLENKVVLITVTGARGRISLVIAKELHIHGVKVVLSDRNVY